jgi:hypothetical protein
MKRVVCFILGYHPFAVPRVPFTLVLLAGPNRALAVRLLVGAGFFFYGIVTGWTHTFPFLSLNAITAVTHRFSANSMSAVFSLLLILVFPAFACISQTTPGLIAIKSASPFDPADLVTHHP